MLERSREQIISLTYKKNKSSKFRHGHRHRVVANALPLSDQTNDQKILIEIIIVPQYSSHR